jgi:hypothetical protein
MLDLTLDFVDFVTCSYGSTSDGQIFTLYRNSMTDENMRIHVATFDASENEAYKISRV